LPERDQEECLVNLEGKMGKGGEIEAARKAPVKDETGADRSRKGAADDEALFDKNGELNAVQ
jgi:hypothetical protein